MRSAAREAVDWALAGAQRVGVLVSATAVPSGQKWSLRGFGVTVGDGPSVDLPVAIARWLLDGRSAEIVPVAGAIEGFDALLVMGDGSSARTEQSPGHLDPRAIPFDDAVLEAVATGQQQHLADIDLDLARRVGAAGAPVWRRLGEAVATVDSATVDAQQDRFGVLYFVARWTAHWVTRA